MAAIQSNPYDLDSLSIAELRKQASVEKIRTDKSWDKEDYIKALNNHRKGRALARLVIDGDSAIPPGYVRIRLPLDQVGSDTPVTIRVNNFSTRIPRNVMVDIPKEARDVLRNSTEAVTRKEVNSQGQTVMRVIDVPCYPFDTLGEAAGESGAIKPNSSYKEEKLRERFRDIYGHWPRRTDSKWLGFRQKFAEDFQAKMIAKAVEEEAADAEE